MARKPKRKDVWETIFMALEDADGGTLADSTDAVMDALANLNIWESK